MAIPDSRYAELSVDREAANSKWRPHFPHPSLAPQQPKKEIRLYLISNKLKMTGSKFELAKRAYDRVQNDISLGR